MDDPTEIAAALGLEPLPIEGGLWTRSLTHPALSSIYFLLVAPEISAWHRLDRPELFVHHAGAPLTMRLIGPDGLRTHVLGMDLAAGERPQVLIPAGTWQASETASWTLVGTVVVPPYTDDCVEFGTPDLVRDYPELARLLP
ncbi:cupin domain-containing protein [Actinokineospora sp. NBRC 105648]|uniref:cupin domain-containing protein n=1 Tax=Actinokineospora sp. NBRC 105648 TaxID=3032206 RepID=UPI0024A5D60B|nr:cupin domain-containing protein [Actinokineospora sp. NBRC 105648]GLZ43032.1 hypothetical protein Acsp05_66560 [Actinokineospora sp. NBRC 105648]